MTSKSIKGYHDAKPSRAHVWEEGKAARECKMIEIWKLEEKQSDVAFALNAFSDAMRNEVDQVIAVTNDSDFAPAMKMIGQHTQSIVGLIAPARQRTGNVNAELQKHAHWTRTHILDQEFAQSHLPPMIRLKNKAVHKPLPWYPRPDLLVPIYEEAKRVKRSEGAARKWLNQPCVHLGGRIPITIDEIVAMAADFLDDIDYLQESPDIPEPERQVFRQEWPNNRSALVVEFREMIGTIRDLVRVTDELGDYVAFSAARRAAKDTDQAHFPPEDPQLNAIKQRAKTAVEKLQNVMRLRGVAPPKDSQ